MKHILVLYHKNCPDGFGAAWAAWKKFGNKADYLAIEHQVPPPKNLVDRKEIYMVDICYRRPILEKLLKVNSNITIIDHHITSKETIKLAKNYSYGLNHSGAVLSWKFFHPKKPVPWLLRHIEDVDLWKWKLPFTAEISVALELYYNNFAFKKWDKIAPDFENAKKRRKYINEGKLILKYRDTILKRIVAGAEKVNFENKKAYAVNSPFWQSEIGNQIVKDKKTIAVIWSRKSGKINVSLRSDGKIDVSKLALKYGGGGHKVAAGFSMDVKKPLPWKTK